jgi:hypothetical protein
MIFEGYVLYTYKFDNYYKAYYKAMFFSLDDLLRLWIGSKSSTYRFHENTGGFNNLERKVIEIRLSPRTLKSIELENNT